MNKSFQSDLLFSKLWRVEDHLINILQKFHPHFPLRYKCVEVSRAWPDRFNEVLHVAHGVRRSRRCQLLTKGCFRKFLLLFSLSNLLILYLRGITSNIYYGKKQFNFIVCFQMYQMCNILKQRKGQEYKMLRNANLNVICFRNYDTAHNMWFLTAGEPF